MERKVSWFKRAVAGVSAVFLIGGSGTAGGAIANHLNEKSKNKPMTVSEYIAAHEKHEAEYREFVDNLDDYLTGGVAKKERKERETYAKSRAETSGGKQSTRSKLFISEPPKPEKPKMPPCGPSPTYSRR